MARWAVNLQDDDYTILHRSGSQMAHVDALSRIQVLTNQCTDSIVQSIKESQELDPHILSIKTLLQKGPYDNYCIKNSILYKFIDGAEVLVITDEMQHHFIKNAHDKGHFSVKRTLEHLKNKYFVPQLQSKIEIYISNCVTCILKNKKSGKQEGFLYHLVKDDIPLNTHHIDHLGPLATSSLLPAQISDIIAREPDDKAHSYEHVKSLLLKRFKLTPENFRQVFVSHQKIPEKTWINFYHELNTYFNGLIDGLKIDTFEKLSDLVITDKLKRKTPFEFKEYYLDEWPNMNYPVQLAENLEEFKDFKKTLKQKSSTLLRRNNNSNPLGKKLADMKHQENWNITEWIRSFQRQQISTNFMKLLSPSTEMFKDIKKIHRKCVTTKITKNTQTTMLPSMLRRTILSHGSSKNEKLKLAHSLLRKFTI
ncbi:retrovirus-related Pol polyprotein from transposon 17.6 [Trichonephila clavipes]|nr:retrovirus-related Pol polyprotein from transposon 17.6 [Trichonephila clavipes]